MRNLLMAGAASLFLAVGAASAYADEIVTPVSGPIDAGGAPAYDAYGNEVVIPAAPALIEGRSAYIERDPMYVPAQPTYVYRPAYVERRVYTPFPFSVLPWNW
jgi:hypothetical protein